MTIQGPTGPPPPVDKKPLSISPGAGSPAAKNPTQTPVASVQVQLSPALFKQGQMLNVAIAKIEQDALLLVLQNRLTDHKGEPLNIQFRVAKFPGAQPGQQLTVHVADIKNNQPVLQLVSTNKPPLDLQATLQQSLVNNRPLQGVFDHLIAAKQSRPEQLALPANVREQLDRLWRSLPELSQLQRPDNLRQALNNAGPFLEAYLAKVATGSEQHPPAMDVRAQLLRLAQTLRQQTPQQPNVTTNTTATNSTLTSLNSSAQTTPAPMTQTNPQNMTTPTAQPSTRQTANAPTNNLPNPAARQAVNYEGLKAEQILQQLLQQTDAGLARIQQQQVQMVQTEARPQWVMELPVKHGEGVDVFDIRIQPDAEQNSQNQKDQAYPWTVMLAFNLEGLGPVRAQISLYNGQISTYWWAEQQQTVSLFHEHLSFLENRLQHAGVSIQQLACECGIPEPRTIANKIPYSDSNLDELA